MKLMKYLLVSFALTAVFFTGCDKEKIQSMTATVDGKEWSATLATVGAYSYSDYLTLFGVSLDGSKILIAIKGKETGTYDLQVLEGSTSQVSFYVPNSSDEDDETKRYISSTGSVTLSSVEDNRISGSFNFTGVNTALNQTIVIENGSFNNVIYLSQ